MSPRVELAFYRVRRAWAGASNRSVWNGQAMDAPHSWDRRGLPLKIPVFIGLQATL